MGKRFAALFAVFLSTVALAGCGERMKSGNEIDDLTKTGEISYQTSLKGIKENSKDFQTQLTSGMYYVVHDGMYYPLYQYGSNNSGAPKDYVEPSRQMYYTTENEINIPTLFEGDELMYYSTEGLLDYMIWERYYDLGYTIGLLNLKTMTSGRVYLDLSDEDTVNIVPDSELYAMYDLGATQVLINKIGGVQVDKSLISDGLIAFTEKSKPYDLEVYTGTFYQHYTTTANTHAFKAYELYASIEYEPLQEFLYRIEVPEYFPTGYYNLNGRGFVRIVRGNSYSEETDYNEQILFPAVDTTAWNYDPEAYVAPRRYSTYEPLNKFSTNIEGALGYVPEDADSKDEEKEETKDVSLKEAVVKEIELYFPEGKKCTVQIKSSTGEITGDISIITDSSVKFLNYDRLEGVYDVTFTGKGEKGILKIAGLTTSYDITLTNCEQYKPDLEQEEQTSAQETEASEVTETEGKATEENLVDQETEESEESESERRRR